ncbi:MAG: hypothetical protein RL769_71 [Pseudomonadota bacterium]|jgi:hypothetical protein
MATPQNKASGHNSRKYQFIAILDSVDHSQSKLDCQPDYLHIHILDSEKGQDFSKYLEQVNLQLQISCNDSSTKNILLQWGLPIDKEAKSRSVVVKAKDLENFDVGLGSFAVGNESFGNSKNFFISGGEAFKMGQKNLRITKGNEVFEVGEEQGYWIFQATNLNNAQIHYNVIDQEIDGREKLLDFLKDKSDSKPFVAMFEASFIGDFYSRSNGIFPEDFERVEDPKKILFSGIESVGGHLLGGSNSKGDIISLQEKLSLTQAKDHNFRIKILSPIILKSFNELRIVKSCSKGLSDVSLEVLAGNEFSRLPRSKVKVLKAVNLLQKFFRSKRNYK